MKPAPFDYIAPGSIEEVLSLLDRYGDDAKLLAGGQSLIPVLNFRLARPAVLVDINRVPDLDEVSQRDDRGLTLGALVRQSRLENSAEVARLAPLLRGAVPYVAHPQIRNRGTVGGSLAHADPAAELPAVAIALDARFQLRSSAASRWVGARDFYTGLFSTALQPQEALVKIEIPPWPKSTGWAFEEFARRHGDYAQAGLAVVAAIDAEGVCTQAKLVFLSVGETPVVAERAARLLVGNRATPELLEEMARVAALEEVDPTNDIHATAEFKRHLCGVLLKRAVALALRRSQETESGEI